MPSFTRESGGTLHVAVMGVNRIGKVESKVFLARASALGLSLDNNTSAQPEHVGCGYEGNDALWAFVTALHAAMTVLQAASANPGNCIR